MTEQECLAALRHANEATNLGAFVSRLRFALEGVPLDGTANADIFTELERSVRRAKRAGLLDPDTESHCRCGHEFSWHEGGLCCLKCKECAVFQPMDKPPTHVRVAEGLTGSKYGTTQSRIEQAQRAPRDALAAHGDPWDGRLTQLREDRREQMRLHQQVVETVAKRLPPGESQHLASARRTRARRNRRDAMVSRLIDAVRKLQQRLG